MSASSTNKPTLYELVYGMISTTIIPVGVESLRLLPDSLVLGTLVLSILSMCKSYAVMVFTMVEVMFIQRILGNIIGGISPIGAGPDAMHGVCQPGFHFPNAMRISLLETIGIPSYLPSPVMFFLSSMITYMISSMNEFSREIKALGGDLATRTTVGVAMGILLMLAMLSFRYSYGCESFGTLLVSLILGGLMGFALIKQNKALFGRDGINILNLPMIQTSEERGKPMFVCAPST